MFFLLLSFRFISIPIFIENMCNPSTSSLGGHGAEEIPDLIEVSGNELNTLDVSLENEFSSRATSVQPGKLRLYHCEKVWIRVSQIAC